MTARQRRSDEIIPFHLTGLTNHIVAKDGGQAEKEQFIELWRERSERKSTHFASHWLQSGESDLRLQLLGASLSPRADGHRSVAKSVYVVKSFIVLWSGRACLLFAEFRHTLESEKQKGFLSAK